MLEPHVLDLVASGEWTTDELIHDLRWLKHIRVSNDGVVTRWRGAELVNSEPADPSLVDGDGTEPATADGPLVSASLGELLEAGDTGAAVELDVVLSLDKLEWSPIVSVEHERMVAMLEGHIDTRRDALAVRHEAMATKEGAGSAALEPLLAWLDGLGVEVVRWSGLTGTVQVRVGSDRLAEPVACDGLAHVDEVVEEDVSAGYPLGTEVDEATIDGVERENLLQSTQFYDDG